jgi:hypothetical protein
LKKIIHPFASFEGFSSFWSDDLWNQLEDLFEIELAELGFNLRQPSSE